MSAVDVRIVPASRWHARSIARNMRKPDRDELAAASGKTPIQGLTYSLRHSSFAWTALVDGVPAVMWGVGDVNIIVGIGAPWLLGTDSIDRHSRAFLRASRPYLQAMTLRYRILRNLVLAENRTAVRWLGWLGFSFPASFSFRGHEFMIFELTTGGNSSGVPDRAVSEGTAPHV